MSKYNIWDPLGKRWLKVCPVDALPHEVKMKILEDKLAAETFPEAQI
jgi:hypothetical protein